MQVSRSDKLRLEMRGITKRFPGTIACNAIDFDLRVGEIHALVGQNGAGKSTLIKVLAGIHFPDAGEIIVDGKRFTHLTPRDAHNLGMRFIHQELNLVPQLNVAENVVLGDPYPLRRASLLISWRDLNRRVQATFKELGIALDPCQPVQTLSVAEQWMVAIARAMYSRGRILVMDEPTSSLSKEDTRALFKLVRSLVEMGTSVIYVSHRLEEIFELAERVTVLRDGQKVTTTELAQLDLSKLVRLMVGRSQQELFPYVDTNRNFGDAVLRIENVSTVDKRIDGVSFEVLKGEVLGITGLLGAGHNELAETIFGVGAPVANGRIYVDGRPYRPRSPCHAIARGIAMVPAERKNQGLIGRQPIWENVILPHLRRFVTDPISQTLHYRRIKEAVINQIKNLGIVTTGLNQEVQYLSGGNQQKVVLAKWLLGNFHVLIMNEPTRGIDVGAKAEIYRLIRNLADSGKAVIFVSSDIEELVGVCDRILVMREGRLVSELCRVQFDVERIVEACYGK